MEKLKSLLRFFTKKRLIVIFSCLAIILTAALSAVLTVSLALREKTRPDIISVECTESFADVDHIIVLGAGLRSDGTPSDMLADRLTVGVALLEKYPYAKLLLTGDNSGKAYNEVAAMKRFVNDLGVDDLRIVTDDRGYSTYESIYNAKNEFSVKKAIIVTQEYHLHRSLYIADRLGIEAKGVGADLRSYRKQGYREIREHMARFKDFFCTLVEYEPN